MLSYQFSDDIACIEIERLSQNIQELADFLCQSFHGGPDLTPALLHAIHILDFQRFDTTI